MKWLKKLMCSHYYEDNPNPKHYYEYAMFLDLGRVNKKTVICNKCGKLKHVEKNYIDIRHVL